LQASLQPALYALPTSQPPLTVNEPRAAYGNKPDPTLSALDQAMLAVYRAMPVEKQLALLSLFK
jgi:hypothetical protein